MLGFSKTLEPTSVELSPARRRHWFRSLGSKVGAFTFVLIVWAAAIVAGDGKRFAFGVAVAISSIAVSVFTTRLFTRPLRQLVLAARRVLAGDLEPIQVTRSGDEVEVLGNGLNAMIQVLAASQAVSRRLEDRFEIAVKQRTAELEQQLALAISANLARIEATASLANELWKLAPPSAGTLRAALREVSEVVSIESGNLQLEPESFELRALVRLLEPYGTVEVSDHPPPVLLGDFRRIHQALSSILEVAIPGRLAISGEPLTDHLFELRIEIPAVAPRVNESVRRLAIAKGIAELHGGSLRRDESGFDFTLLCELPSAAHIGTKPGACKIPVSLESCH